MFTGRFYQKKNEFFRIGLGHLYFKPLLKKGSGFQWHFQNITALIIC